MGFLFHGLEGKKIFHFDIKPDNILVKDGNYLIADFGTSYVKKNKNIKSFFFFFYYKKFNFKRYKKLNFKPWR
jgi:serine/threonine protein kinase